MCISIPSVKNLCHHLFEKILFLWFTTVRVFRGRLEVCVCMCLCMCPSFPFVIEIGMWDLVIVFPDYYLSFLHLVQLVFSAFSSVAICNIV